MGNERDETNSPRLFFPPRITCCLVYGNLKNGDKNQLIQLKESRFRGKKTRDLGNGPIARQGAGEEPISKGFRGRPALV